jgi:hypothetical protein
MGRLMVRPSEDMRNTLPVRSSVSLLEVVDEGEQSDRVVEEDEKENSEAIVNWARGRWIVEKWM